MSNRFDGYMNFMVDTPLIGLDPMPGSAPDETVKILPTTAQDWRNVFFIQETYVEAIEEAKAYFDPDFQELGPDFVMRVSVDDQGNLSVYDHNQSDPLIVYTAADVYDAFGMTPPTQKGN